jgi:serine/threonine-protein kinase
MEYLEGQALDRIRRHCADAGVRLPPRAVARILVDALDGLRYAHELKDYDGSPLQIVHRDISPQNVFVTYDGVVKLLDFGIAKAKTQVVETRTGIVKGKFAYMSPEQARGVDVDHRADLWSAGVVLWETLANRRLFKAPTDVATLNQALMGEIPAIDKLVPEIPPQLTRVVNKALSRDVRKRYASALEMSTDIERSMAADPAGLAERSDLADLMKRMFAEVIEQHRALLQICLSETPAQQLTSSGRHRAVGPAPRDLDSTPGSGVSAPEYAPVSGRSDPAGDSMFPFPTLSTPVSSHSALYPLVQPPKGRLGWLGKAVVLAAAVSLAVMSTLLVMWLYTSGPPERGADAERPLARPVAGPRAPEPELTKERHDAGPTGGAKAAPVPAIVPSEPRDPLDAAPGAAPVVKVAQRPERPPEKRDRPAATKGPAAAPEPAPAPPGEGPADAAAQTEPEPIRAAEEFGFLTIDTMPWSQVSVGGQALGVTPVIRAKLPAGTHVVTLRNPERGIATTYRVTINPGQTTSKRLGLR